MSVRERIESSHPGADRSGKVHGIHLRRMAVLDVSIPVSQPEIGQHHAARRTRCRGDGSFVQADRPLCVRSVARGLVSCLIGDGEVLDPSGVFRPGCNCLFSQLDSVVQVERAV
jgi:hypothetical protein